MRRLLKALLSLTVIAAAGVLLTELALSLLLDHGAILAYLPHESLRHYYMQSDRAIIQFLPECARYDPELTYTLRPGTCRFANREFDTSVEVNSLGVRDDEASLERPEIVVLGDSQAMGWGVGQQSTFAQLLEAETGLRVLNAAVSSYGTVREVRMLERIDTRALRDLIIQYCDNDYRENLSFQQHANVLPISDRTAYEQQTVQHREQTRYFLGKHVLSLGRRLADTYRRPPAVPREPPDEVEVFLNALAAAPIPWDGVRVLLLEVVGRGRNDDRFLGELERRLAAGVDARIPSNLVLVEIAEDLRPEDFYVLDDHMTARAHRAVADTLLPFLLRDSERPIGRLFADGFESGDGSSWSRASASQTGPGW